MAKFLLTICALILSLKSCASLGVNGDVEFEERYVTEDDLLTYRTCVRKHKEKNSYVGDRFNDLQLAASCKREKEWYDFIASHPNSTVFVKYTEKQTTYMHRIQYCRQLSECYSDTMPIRNYGPDFNHRKRRQSTGTALRKECRTLSRRELDIYFDTLNRLKNDNVDGSNKYDLLIAWHLPAAAPGAHFGPSFLPYHRELLKQLEVAGRQVNPSFALCYWDSTLDFYLPRPADSVLWMDNFFGNGNGHVTTGPFANWRTTSVTPGANGNRLYRLIGQSATATMYNPADINRLMNSRNFQELCCYCLDPSFELLHAGVHDFVGGFMTYINQSPNDPVFFNHHCFIDYFWQRWRQTRQSADQRETDYPADGAACGTQYRANSPMSPFPITNIDGLSTTYDSLYRYQDSPTCQNGLCTGDFLFCNTNTNRCMSKIRPGGLCTGLQGQDSCYQSMCNGQTCVGGQQQDIPQQQRPTVSRNRQQGVPWMQQQDVVVNRQPVRNPPPVRTSNNANPFQWWNSK